VVSKPVVGHVSHGPGTPKLTGRVIDWEVTKPVDLAEEMARLWCSMNGCKYESHTYDAENNQLLITARSREPIEFITIETTVDTGKIEE
jgi:poly(3-hydroxybutyrate) depolymerase